VKSKQRQEIADLAAKRFDRLKEKRSEQAQQRTGHENLKLILGLGSEVAEPKPEPQQQIKPKVVLYLREGVNPAQKNFTKYPNAMHDLMAGELNEFENILYVKLWRESWGRGKNHCRISYGMLLGKTSLRSLSTVRRSIAGLKGKRFIILVLNEGDEPDKNKQGTLYRVSTPEELVSGQTEEGIRLDDLPTEGVFCVNIVTESIVANVDNTGNNATMFSRNMVIENSVHTEHSQTEHSSMSSQTIAPENTETQNADNSTSMDGALTEHSQTEHAFKEDSLKDSLSPDLIELFYTGIGQERISKVKREKGDSVLKELQKEGFSPADIQFAIEWTLKPENTKEKVHDFSIISHTIGQALAAREATQQAAESARKEAARVSAAEEERKRLEGEIERKFAEMGPDEVAELEKQAREALSGVQAEFITEMSIRGKMKEILGRS